MTIIDALHELAEALYRESGKLDITIHLGHEGFGALTKEATARASVISPADRVDLGRLALYTPHGLVFVDSKHIALEMLHRSVSELLLYTGEIKRRVERATQDLEDP